MTARREEAVGVLPGFTWWKLADEAWGRQIGRRDGTGGLPAL